MEQKENERLDLITCINMVHNFQLLYLKEGSQEDVGTLKPIYFAYYNLEAKHIQEV